MNPTPATHLTTQLLSADCEGDIELAAGLLRVGNLVAIPTETVYGLAANAMNEVAVGNIFAAKHRPHWDPLIVHVSDEATLKQTTRKVSSTARKLMNAFWPGPLTLLLPRHASLPGAVTAGRDLVGVRMPRHPVALEVIRTAGLPLAAPSANLFGHISPTTAQHVMADLRGRIDAVLDAGPCAIGVESTVLDPEAMVLYRQGGVGAAAIERVAGLPVTVYVPPASAATPESLPSPGVGVRHYAPRARLVLVGSEVELTALLSAADAEQTGVMLPAGWSVQGARPTFAWGRWDVPASLAESLYRGLRALDDSGVQRIVCPLPTGDDSLLQAIRDRLLKAARLA